MACNCINTKYDKNSNIISAYQIVRMNKQYLIEEPKIKSVNANRTDIELCYNDTSLLANGIVIPTAISPNYCNLKVIHAFVVPLDASIPMTDLSTEIDKLVLDALNAGALADNHYISVKINLNSLGSIANMLDKPKKITIQIRLYNPEYYRALILSELRQLDDPEFRQFNTPECHYSHAPEFSDYEESEFHHSHTPGFHHSHTPGFHHSHSPEFRYSNSPDLQQFLRYVDNLLGCRNLRQRNRGFRINQIKF